MPYPRLLIAALAVLLPLALSSCDSPQRPTVNLYRAVHSGDLDQIKRHLFWQTDINSPGPDGDYPLHVAVRQGRVAIARELIKHGAELDRRNAADRTPLHLALAEGKVPAALLLLERGADDDLQALLLKLMHEGVADRDTLELLTARGVDLNAPDPEGQAPLHIAAAAGDVRLARRLIGAGADVDRTDAAGRTPLAIAAEADEPVLMELFQQYGGTR